MTDGSDMIGPGELDACGDDDDDDDDDDDTAVEVVELELWPARPGW